jgi:hypothetical protein
LEEVGGDDNNSNDAEDINPRHLRTAQPLAPPPLRHGLGGFDDDSYGHPHLGSQDFTGRSTYPSTAPVTHLPTTIGNSVHVPATLSTQFPPRFHPPSGSARYGDGHVSYVRTNPIANTAGSTAAALEKLFQAVQGEEGQLEGHEEFIDAALSVGPQGGQFEVRRRSHWGDQAQGKFETRMSSRYKCQASSRLLAGGL